MAASHSGGIVVKTFLLRFQEPRVEANQFDPSRRRQVIAGTKTATEVRREDADADPGTRDMTILPRELHGAASVVARPSVPLPATAGTVTKTAVRTEGEDNDPTMHMFDILPRDNK
jgi:hypothetical protein